MTKAERLLFLVNLFRVRRRITLEELARECEVSTRTIYRDIVSLSNLNVPIYYDGGYRLTKGVSLPPLAFTRDEQEIIGYCLRNSPLVKSPRLRGIIKNIELKILSTLRDRKQGRLNSLLIGSDNSEKPFTPKQDKLIELFFKACVEHSAVDVVMQGKRRELTGVYPSGLEVCGPSWWFRFTDANGGRTKRVQLDRVDKIRSLRSTVGRG
ncbi:MAG: HTH domain-containing protein [candidate division Zixibacteria bacterium]|nr:HTH domain-containing protein [candidate division Zixibacteria bacterium]